MLSLIGIMFGGIGSPLAAQLASPGVRLTVGQAPVASSSAAEAAYYVDVQKARTFYGLSYKDAKYPKDSMDAVVTATAQRWLEYLRAKPIHGIQVDPYGMVNVAGKQDAIAEQELLARFNDTALSLDDRAYTAMTAVTAFADPEVPERLAVAERFVKQLDELGPAVAFWRFVGHRTLQGAYYAVGKGGDVIRHGEIAVALIKDIDFFDRQMALYSEGRWGFYAEIADALSGRPDGRTRLEAIDAKLLEGTVPSPALVATDSNFAILGRMYNQGLRRVIGVAKNIGAKGRDIEGNYWINRSGAGVAKAESYTMPVANGKITILELGGTTCVPCMYTLNALQRLQRQFPQIQTVFATFTNGSLGARLVDAAAEAEAMGKRLVERNGIREVPISLWMSKKVRTEEDGWVPESEGPNAANYQMVGEPTIYILDGKGIIRHVRFSGIGRDDEKYIAQTINFLLRESETASAP